MIIPIKIHSLGQVLASLRSRERLALGVDLKAPFGFTELLYVTGLEIAHMELNKLPDAGSSWFITFVFPSDCSPEFSEHVYSLVPSRLERLSAIWESRTKRGLLFYIDDTGAHRENDLESVYELCLLPPGEIISAYLQGDIKARTAYNRLNPELSAQVS